MVPFQIQFHDFPRKIIPDLLLDLVQDQLQDSFEENHGIGFEMGPYGSIRAHIKTGRSHMAQDHF